MASFSDDIKELIEKHYGKIAEMKTISPSRKSDVFLEVYAHVAQLMERDFTYALQILEGKE